MSTDPTTPEPDAQTVPQEDHPNAEEALEQAESAVSALKDLNQGAKPRPTPMPEFQPSGAAGGKFGIDLLSRVSLNVRIELGRTKMLVEDVLRLNEGSVVELDKLAGDPVDIYANDRLVATGEVLVLNDTFCVRINEVVASFEDEESAEAA